MDTWVWVIILIVVVIVAVAATYVITTRVRSAQLKKRFGPEYDRAVESSGDRKDAESELRDIAKRRDRYEIVPLDASRRRHYAAEWEKVQRTFVDQPGTAVVAADELIASAMAERGYPVERFDDRADMVSADHPEVVTHYRTAHAIRRRGTDATTEELREAFVHYRALFDQMLSDDGGATEEPAGRRGTERGRHGGRHGNAR